MIRHSFINKRGNEVEIVMSDYASETPCATHNSRSWKLCYYKELKVLKDGSPILIEETVNKKLYYDSEGYFYLGRTSKTPLFRLG